MEERATQSVAVAPHVRGWRVWVGVLALVGLVWGASRLPPQRRGATLEQGDREYFYGRLDAAAALYRETAEAGDWRGWQRLGWIDTLENNDAQALQDYRQALALAPEDRRTLLQAAATALRQQRWDLARDCLRRVLRQSPPSLEAHSLMATLESRQGHPDKAALWLRQVLEINPYQPTGNLALAHLLEARGDWAGAETHYRAAVGLNALFDARSNYQDGLALLHLNRPREALSQFRQATGRDETLALAWYMRGVVEHDLDPAQSDRSLSRFLELQPKGPEAETAHRLLGQPSP